MNAVRVNDIWKHLDISHIQPYIVNSLEVLHLNARPRPKNATRMWTHPCEICGHNLNDSFRFCSLACKVCKICFLFLSFVKLVSFVVYI